MAGLARKPVYFTFGNHMHWVDMQWLWGYDVLPGSVRDMIHLCREAGVKGNVNFDAVGYEKMAAECPEALAELREAVAQGIIEPVGCSYGQPYGLFHGAESNIRQLTFGVRTTRRLLGVRPRAFWEEEFYFFPQLPQMLRQCGYTGACLFFQWTWHTPEVPREPHALIQWEGLDGSRLPTLPRNDLNLHQWPEDFAPLLTSKLLRELDQPAIVQWVELMPSRDWMCRSEVLLPKLKELQANPEFEIVPGTLSEVIAKIGHAEAPVRRYTMDDVWHGMTLGKNGDRHPRTSRACEHAILAAESLAATASLLGRPYAQWDVYPTWELEEAWRELLAAQHHDNHECEGLCGSIGFTSMRRAEQLARPVPGRVVQTLASRVAGEHGPHLSPNLLGWPVEDRAGSRMSESNAIPPFGFRVEPPSRRATGRQSKESVKRTRNTITLSRGSLVCTIDRRTGCIVELRGPGTRGSLVSPKHPLLQCRTTIERTERAFDKTEIEVEREPGFSAMVTICRTGRGGISMTATVHLSLDADAVDVTLGFEAPRPDPGLLNALSIDHCVALKETFLIADSPGAVHQVSGFTGARRKYPTGDWMTSPQWFEDLPPALTAMSFVDFIDSRSAKGRGLLVIHDGAQQFFTLDDRLRQVLVAYDPWDEDNADCRSGMMMRRLRFIPHGCLSNAQRVQFSSALEPPFAFSHLLAQRVSEAWSSEMPRVFGPLSVEDAPGVLATAFHRESSKSGEHLPDWAGHEMARRSGGACTHPFVIRLVEYDGEPAEVTLKLVGPVAGAAKTNLMGEVGPHVACGQDTRWLDVAPAEPPQWAIDPNSGSCYEFRGRPLEWSQVRFRMRPHEIATIYADMVMGRKEYRDLDAKREVWATVHRDKQPGERR
ncbi:MAG: hypothetical protein KJZ69_09745 [Phycisphaerales bacterium]|nr:hypothetical protein [Phycisphaerales bacterium]